MRLTTPGHVEHFDGLETPRAPDLGCDTDPAYRGSDSDKFPHPNAVIHLRLSFYLQRDQPISGRRKNSYSEPKKILLHV